MHTHDEIISLIEAREDKPEFLLVHPKLFTGIKKSMPGGGPYSCEGYPIKSGTGIWGYNQDRFGFISISPSHGYVPVYPFSADRKPERLYLDPESQQMNSKIIIDL